MYNCSISSLLILVQVNALTPYNKDHPATPTFLIPTSTYFCLIVGFEHIADTLLIGCIIFNQTSKITWVVTIVNQFVNSLRLTLEDAGTDQWIPLLTFSWLRLTSQSRRRNTEADWPGARLLFGRLPAESAHLRHHPRQHRHGGQTVHRQGAHQLEAEAHRGLARQRVSPRCEGYWLHVGKGLETQQNVATVFLF